MKEEICLKTTLVAALEMRVEENDCHKTICRYLQIYPVLLGRGDILVTFLNPVAIPVLGKDPTSHVQLLPIAGYPTHDTILADPGKKH